MDVLTRNSDTALPPVGNPRAVASVLLAVLAVPGGVVLSWYSKPVTLVNSAEGSAPVAFLLGLLAIQQARRGRDQLQRTLGRSGGGAAASFGRVVGLVGVCGGLVAALSLGFYGLLVVFAR